MSQRRFTLEDGKEWRERYEKGETFEQIGLSYTPFIQTTTIRKWALKAGVVSRSPAVKMNERIHVNPKGAATPSIQTGVKLTARAKQGKRRHTW